MCLLFSTIMLRKNAIHLPGRIPGYKKDTIQLLPSSTTKNVQPTKIIPANSAYVCVCV